jgi:hypothetical protein
MAKYEEPMGYILEGDALQASIERARTGVANLSRVTPS